MNDFFIFLEKLELIAFFGGFPLVYFLVYFISTDFSFGKNWLIQLPKRLPVAYAFTTLLFVGMKLDQWIRSHGAAIDFRSYLFYFQAWAFLGLLFFSIFFRRKPHYTLLHSVPFISLLIFDFYTYYKGYLQVEMLHNEMRLYGLGTILNIISVLIVSSLYLIFKKRSV